MSNSEIKIISTGYTPRPYQQKLHTALGKVRFSVQVWHRRAGKTVATVNDMLDKALHCEKENLQYAYIVTGKQIGRAHF